ncbi:MAG: hypothetical protein E6Y08_11320 [Paenibacillus sp.]|uniref:hypothetical protein n=1 Tax=Paenibacillus sp. TaxID=58172 RepID=UPI00290E1C3D|nr:hypothetical protein [Paenibacillus sp.]MDU4696398.1 hypothetical protein [Paenibacillus sp.]
MAGKRKDGEKLITVQAAVPVVIWRATRPLNEHQHKELARKLESEQERSGMKVMLVPNSVEPEIGASLEDQQSTQTSDEIQLEDDETKADDSETKLD